MHVFSLTALLATLCRAQQYALQSSFSGPTFFDNFNFWTAGDPTYGYVHYVDQAVAEQHGMITTTASGSAVWGVDTTQYLDPTANLGRLSIRLTSVQSWTHGLFILDLAHMPANQCGVWPAFWTLGSGTWPENGEIDIIEFTNNAANNLMALHTSASPNCTIAGSDQTGTLLTHDCAAAEGYTGCGVSATTPQNIGYDFNTAAGGVYAMEWTSTAIKIWFFPRDRIPASILEANGDVGPDPSAFGLPVANFQGSCDFDAHFYNHSLIFDTTFCGSYAGNLWAGAGCPLHDPTNGWQSCNDFVAANPGAFTETYWEVNYLNIYQTAAGSVQAVSSSLSSVVPAASTSPVATASGNAEGRPTTPTMQFPVSLTSSAINVAITGSESSNTIPLTNMPPLVTSSQQPMEPPSPYLTSVDVCANGGCTTEVVTVVQTVTVAVPPPAGGPRQEPMSMMDRRYRVQRQPVERDSTYCFESQPSTLASSPTVAKAYSDLNPIGTTSTLHPKVCRAPSCAVDDAKTLIRGDAVHVKHTSAVSSSPSADTTGSWLGYLPAPMPLPNSQSPRAVVMPRLPSMTSEPGKHVKRRQVVPGGSMGFCSVPGSSCNEHHKRMEPEDAGAAVSNVHAESPVPSLITPRPGNGSPPVIHSTGADGVLVSPPMVREQASHDSAAYPGMQKDYKYQVVYVTVVETDTLPAYAPTMFPYDPATKRGPVVSVEPTTASEFQQEPVYTSEPSTVLVAETTSHTPGSAPPRRDGGGTSTTGSTVVGKLPSASSTLTKKIVRHTCTPAVMLQADGTPTNVGCIAPKGVLIAKTESLWIANTTSTITDPRGSSYSRLASPDQMLSDLVDEKVVSEAAPTPIRTCVTIGIITCVVAALTW